MTFFLKLISRLPLRWCHALGAALGWATYLASPGYRRHLRENLRLAYPELPSGVLRGAIAHTGRAVLEMPYLWLRPRREVLRLVRRVNGWELAEAARGDAQGIIFVTPHLGCFEIAAKYIAAHMPITVLYRPPKLAWLLPLMEVGRGGDNVVLAPADQRGVRQLMRALKRAESIGMLPDQVPGKGEGVWADFFGRPAYTMTLLGRLTLLERSALIFVYGERLARGDGFHLHFMAAPVAVSGTPAERSAAINRCVESLVRACPEQYLWGYNRYKRPAGAPPPPPCK